MGELDATTFILVRQDGVATPIDERQQHSLVKGCETILRLTRTIHERIGLSAEGRPLANWFLSGFFEEAEYQAVFRPGRAGRAAQAEENSLRNQGASENSVSS